MIMKTSRVAAALLIATRLAALAAALACLTLVAAIAAPVLAVSRRLSAWRPPPRPSATVTDYGCLVTAGAAGAAAAIVGLNGVPRRGATPRDGAADGGVAVADAAGVADGAGTGDTDAVGLCVICRFGHGVDAMVLACGHAYHPGCIDSWLAIRTSCPLCAAAVTAAAVPRPVAASGTR